MPVTRNQPVPGEDLDISQPFLTNNTNSFDDWTAVNHYASSVAENFGKHEVIQTPSQSVHPVTDANEPAFYATQDAATIGVLQYSRPGSSGIPSPVTTLQSAPNMTIGPNSAINVVDFSGVTQVQGIAYGFDAAGGTFPQTADFVFTNSGPISRILNANRSSTLSFSFTGTVLRFGNKSGTSLTGASWTIQFLRIIP